MPGPNTSAKTQLTITPCNVNPKTGQAFPVEKDSYKAMINPAELTQKLGIEYESEVAPGRIASQAKFAAMRPATVDFKLVLDGTGVVPPANDKAKSMSVRDHLEALLKVVYVMDGKKHQPNHVRLMWGSFVFYGRLTSLSTQYTLFKANGDPLRAHVTLSFVNFKTKSAESRETDKNSPDLSHSVEVLAGDTLPLLCHRIYGDERYYMAVARFNGLDDFRRLRPGTRLHFPPLS